MGDNFYVVESGAFDYIVDGKKVGEAHAKDSFGELALLYNSPRAATVVATAPAKVWLLPRDNFRKIVAASVNKSLHDVKNALKSVPLLQDLDDSQLTKLVDAVTVVSYMPGDVIIRKGDVGEVFYFIKRGEVDCTKIGAAVR